MRSLGVGMMSMLAVVGSSVVAGDVSRVVVFGDSIAAFRGGLKVASFQLEERERKQGVNVQVFNAGIPGNTTTDGAARFDRDVLGLKPQLAFISFGTNDAAIDVSHGKTEPRIALETYRKNFQRFIRGLKAQGAITAVYSPPPMVMTDNLKPFYNMPPYTEKGFNFMLDRYIAALREIAAAEGAYFIDVNKKFKESVGDDPAKLATLLADGMHPNQKGQDLVAAALGEWFDANAKNLALKAYGDVKSVEIIKPESGGKYRHIAFDKTPLKCDLSFKWAAALDAVETRYKSHDPSVSKTYSDWSKLEYRREGDVVSGAVQFPGKGCYTLQVRCLVGDKTVGVGKQDFIWAGN